jgi:hypothetical protein
LPQGFKQSQCVLFVIHCDDFLSTFFEDSRQKQALNMLKPAYRDYMFAKCISTDDPRLEEK